MIADLERLAKRMRSELAQAKQHAEEWKGKGYGVGKVSIVSTRPVLDPTGDAAVSDALRCVAAAERLEPALRALKASVRLVDRCLDDLKPVAPLEAKPVCTNCGQSSNWPDRWGLKDGRCVQCYEHHRKKGHDRLLDVGRLSDTERRKCLICERAA